jgi:hypothetical protein
MKWPTIKEVAKALRDVKPWHGRDEADQLDVRLQVLPEDTSWGEGAWHIHTGDAQYDTDHRGFWGASMIDARTNCRELAKELLDEAKDHYSQCIPY